MSTHTPGPWAYQHPTKGSPYAYVVDSVDRPICELNDNRVNYEANARLLAAAPELLAAVKELSDPQNEGTVDRDRAARIAALIAKAEDRKP